MAACKFAGVVFLLVVCLSVSSISAQKECFTMEWAKGLIPCFTAKFIPLLEMLPLPEGALDNIKGGGRTLLSTTPVFPRQSASKGKLMYEFSQAMVSNHEYFERMIGEAMAGDRLHTKASRSREDILRRLQALDIDALLHEYSDEMLDLAFEFRERLSAISYKLNPAIDTMDIKDTIQTILDQVCGSLVPQEVCDFLTSVLSCLQGYSVTDFEDNIKWARCFYTCSDLPFATQCVRDVFSGCSIFWPIGDVSGLGDIAMRGFVEIMGLDQCHFEILEPSNITIPMELIEGAEAQEIKFKMYMPPALHCLNIESTKNSLGFLKAIIEWLTGKLGKCDVSMQISTYTYINSLTSQRIKATVPVLGERTFNIGRPTCRSRRTLEQVAIGWHDHANTSSGIITMTDENWNANFTVPIRASIDSKNDGDLGMELGGILLNADITIKLKAGLRTKTTVKLPTNIIDQDEVDVKQCSILTDPHITTFDQVYFNNYYEGHFYLYKHDNLAYDVQAVLQRCNSTVEATCTCGVAVSSGDDVFVVDRCRRIGEDYQITRAIMYVNGEITPGTRVFRRNNGFRYDVLLPQGTMVKIVLSGDHLNVFIKPSAVDRDEAIGLCGIFNGGYGDDLTYPNGSMVVDVPTGSVLTEQPREYINAWRVPEADIKFWGALEGDGVGTTGADKYCHCHHILLLGNKCECGWNQLVEDCDIDPAGEMIENITLITRSSVKDYLAKGGMQNEPELDIDLDFVPPEFDWADSSSDQKTIEKECKSYIEGDAMVAKCKSIWGFFSNPFVREIKSCEDDYLVTNSMAFSPYAREAAKERCRDRLYLGIDYSWDDVESYNILSCLNSCSDQGQCINGTCVCNEGRSGADCSQISGATPELNMLPTLLCDTRDEDCSIIKMYGSNLLQEYKIQCNVIPLEISDSGLTTNGDEVTIDSVFISPNQLACNMSSIQGLYRVSIQSSITQLRLSTFATGTQVTGLSYDGVCYTCDPTSYTCQEKPLKDHCLINGVCYAPYDLDPENSCMHCDPQQLTDDWSIVPTDECHEVHRVMIEKEEQEKRADKIRIISASVLSAAVAITALVLFCMVGNASKEKEEMSKAYPLPQSTPVNGLNGETEMGVVNAGFYESDIQKESYSQNLAKHHQEQSTSFRGEKQPDAEIEIYSEAL